MGLFGKIIILIIILAGAWYAYNNIYVDVSKICISKNAQELPITCIKDQDCVNYLVSAYTIGYPDTLTFRNILNEVTYCQGGKCQKKLFVFKDSCSGNETSLLYRLTPKDWIAIKKLRR